MPLTLDRHRGRTPRATSKQPRTRRGADLCPAPSPGSTMGQVRVVVTRIERDGTMYRRMVDTAQQSNPRNWEHLAARALAIHPPYRPIPGTAVYHLRVDGHIIQVGEYDLDGPLRDLAVVVLAIGSTPLPGPGGRQAWQPNWPRLPTRSGRPAALARRPGRIVAARWLPVLDGPGDVWGQVAQLQARLRHPDLLHRSGRQAVFTADHQPDRRPQEREPLHL